MSPQMKLREKWTLPVPKPPEYPHDEMPEDMVMASKPSLMKQRLENRGHKVTEDANGLYHEAQHGILPVKVRYFVPADDKPWRITDRARILRALKLFAFFVINCWRLIVVLSVLVGLALAFHLF